MSETTWWGEDVIPYIPLRIEVPSYERIPSGYAVAYRLWNRDASVCMPEIVAPLVGLWRRIRFWMLCPPWVRATARDERLYQQGLDAGFRLALANMDAMIDHKLARRA